MRERLLRWRRRVGRQHWLMLLGLGLAAYFGYHAVDGSRGLLAWQEVTAALEASRQQLAEVHAEREALESKVRRLRHGSLDPDLIDELARRELSFAQPLDVIVLQDGGGDGRPR